MIFNHIFAPDLVEYRRD